MTIAETPVTAATIPPQGVELTIAGEDANGNPSTIGLSGITFTDSDPAGAFTFTVSADGTSATLVPNTTAVASVTVDVAVANSAGTPLTASWTGDVPPGPAVSVSVVATPLPEPVPEAPAAETEPAVEAAPTEAPAAS